MTLLLWAQTDARLFLHLFPLVVVVSLVYSATRHEDWSLILGRAARLACMIFAFMGLILVVLLGFQFRPMFTLTLTVLTLAGLFILQYRKPAAVRKEATGRGGGIRAKE